MADKKDFVELMMEKTKEKGPAEPQNSTGTANTADQKEVEKELKKIREKIQKS